jgi:hypothetical protein
MKNTRLKECQFRLDLKGVSLKRIQEIFRDQPFTIKKDAMLNIVKIKGKGTGAEVLDFLAAIVDKLSNRRCNVVRARVVNVANDYYLSVLGDGRVIVDID